MKPLHEATLTVPKLQQYRQELDWIGQKLGIVKQEDWHNVRGTEVRKRSRIISEHYKGSLFSALRSVYPEYTWNPLAFHTVPQRYWKEKKNHRYLLDRIAEQLGIEKQEDWYQFTGKDIRTIGAHGLLSDHYNNSLYRALETIFPEYEWNPYLFHSAPLALLQEKRRKNHRSLMDWFGVQLGIGVQSDWYSVSGKEIKNLGGENILKYHNSSLFQSLQSVYPEYEWDPTLFHSLPKHFLRTNYNIITKDFNRIHKNNNTTKDFNSVDKNNKNMKNDNKKLMYEPMTDNSIKAFPLMIIKDKKKRVHRELWNSIGSRLGIKQQEDWYAIGSKQVQVMGGDSILNRHYNDSVFYSLQCLYPEFDWNPLLSHHPPRNYIAKIQPGALKESLDGEVSNQWKSTSWMALAYSK